jgi:hypothetical protein
MDFESGDIYMSGWVATCVNAGRRLYATESGATTERIDQAAWRRWGSQADALALVASASGLPMVAETVAEVLFN